jgi:hypothetical protein
MAHRGEKNALREVCLFGLIPRLDQLLFRALGPFQRFHGIGNIDRGSDDSADLSVIGKPRRQFGLQPVINALKVWEAKSANSHRFARETAIERGFKFRKMVRREIIKYLANSGLRRDPEIRRPARRCG